MPPEGLAGISNAVLWKLLIEIFASKHLRFVSGYDRISIYAESLKING